MSAPDLSDQPVWLDGQEVPTDDVIPLTADVVVIGAGYTGLNAALEIARGGRSVAVLDALTPGGGCSSRNGGQVSTVLEHDPGVFDKRFGAEIGATLRAEGARSVDWLESFVAREGIDCDFTRCGHYHAAHTPQAYAHMEQAADQVGAVLVPRDQQLRELGSAAYFGGVVLPRDGALDPAKYMTGLLKTVRAAGVLVTGGARVKGLEKTKIGFELETAKGRITANDVVIATNGYSGQLVPWLARRIIPIGSYVIATEPLDPSLIDELFPTGRTVTDSRRVIYYYRASPDRRRVIFGGRVSAGETDTRKSGPKLQREMVRLFPKLASAKISHSWMGYVAYTFDELPHIGMHDGLHYAMGYCGSGVAMAGYLGHKLGRRVLGLDGADVAFDQVPHITQPLYRGKPWFLPAAVWLFRGLDRYETWRAGSGVRNG